MLKYVSLLFVGLMLGTPVRADETYDKGTIIDEASAFFGDATEDVAKVIEKVFDDLGEPNAYVAGEELSAALVVGVRYGDGQLNSAAGADRRVYWKGPSIGFDAGGNASKVFALIYNLENTDALFQRFPGVEGSLYYVGGAGVTYQQSGDTIIAPIRLGAGLRAGANVGYIHYTKKREWSPF